jgi:hypothetical protein
MPLRRSIAVLVVGTSVLVGALLGASASAATSHKTSGIIHVWSEQNTTATSPIVFTGVIGDYGNAISIDKNGKTDEGGSYVRIVLKKGSFEVNAVALGKAFSKVQPTFSRGCAGAFTGTAPVTLFNGAGAYAGISGTVTVTNTGAFILPTLKNGKCNESNSAVPVAQYSTITGSGTVSFG